MKKEQENLTQSELISILELIEAFKTASKLHLRLCNDAAVKASGHSFSGLSADYHRGKSDAYKEIAELMQENLKGAA